MRQLPIGRRLDLEAAVTRLRAVTEARIIVADIRCGIDVAAAKDRRLIVHTLAEAKVAFDDGVGNIDAVLDDGDAGAAGVRGL